MKFSIIVNVHKPTCGNWHPRYVFVHKSNSLDKQNVDIVHHVPG